MFITSDNNASINTPEGLTDANGHFTTTVSNTQIGLTGFSAYYDSNGDGLVDLEDTLVINGDTADVTFIIDPNGDPDEDGIVNSEEDTDNDENPYNDDCDEDGTPNFLDSDSCNDNDLKISTAFSPNGDGQNDYWVINGIENYPNAQIMVYNRWGHEVFRAKGYENNWEGNYQENSQKLPPSSYYYVINLGDGSPFIDGWMFISY